jgi:hypothetical protein
MARTDIFYDHRIHLSGGFKPGTPFWSMMPTPLTSFCWIALIRSDGLIPVGSFLSQFVGTFRVHHVTAS